jgi:hypothetical protein
MKFNAFIKEDSKIVNSLIVNYLVQMWYKKIDLDELVIS